MTTAIASNKRSKTSCRWAFAAGAVLCACIPTSSFADEGGVSFWLPGLFGSLAATPLQPGLTFSSTFYHTSVTGEGDVSRAREITVGRFPINFSGSANLQLDSGSKPRHIQRNLRAPTPVLGGQAAVGLMGLFGRVNTSVFGTLNGALQGPGGMLLPFSRSDSIGDAVFGIGDLYPQLSLRWNFGVYNFMTYATGDIPVGSYSSNSPIEYRDRAWCGGCWWRVHLLQSRDRPRIFGRPWVHLQFQEPIHSISERCRPALRLGRLAIREQGSANRSRRICL